MRRIRLASAREGYDMATVAAVDSGLAAARTVDWGCAQRNPSRSLASELSYLHSRQAARWAFSLERLLPVLSIGRSSRRLARRGLSQESPLADSFTNCDILRES